MHAKKRTDPTLGGTTGTAPKNCVSQMRSKETQAGTIRNIVNSPKSVGVTKIKNTVNSPS